MGKLAIAVFGGLLLLPASLCAAQQIEYNRHLLELQKTLPQWRADVLEVDANRSWDSEERLEIGQALDLRIDPPAAEIADASHGLIMCL